MGLNMKAIITADLHVEEGIKTEIAINFLNYLQNYCNNNEIKTIIFAGDVLEKSSKISNEAFVPLFFKMMELKESGLQLYFLLGNHDIYNVNNDSLIDTFAVFGKVIKDYETIEIEDKKVDFLPYTKKLPNLISNSDVLITHLPIAEFSFDNKYHANEKHGFKPSLFEDYSFVFSGHFHRPQEKYNITYVGSPYQLGFEESGQNKSFIELVYYDNDIFYTRVEYNEAPEYIKIKVKEFNNVDVKNKFVGVIIDEKVDNFVQLKHVLYENGALNVVPFFAKEKNEIDNAESEININESITEMIKEYIESISLKGIDNQKLLNCFDQILEKVT